MCGCGRDLDPFVLPSGPKGDQGIQGLTGSTGLPGADGAEGAPGADGAGAVGGVTLLHNDLTPGSTNSLTFGLFSVDKVYSAPIGTLPANGDKLEITVLLHITKDGGLAKGNRGDYQILIGGTDIAGALNSFPYGGTNSTATDFAGINAYYKAIVKVSRVSSTSLLIDSISYQSRTSGFVTSTYNFIDTYLTVADVASNALVIQVKGKTDSVNSTLTCVQLTVNNLIQ